MSKILNSEDVIQHKKKAIRKLNALLETLINSGNDDFLKKVDLLSYWIETFSTYIQTEQSFTPKKLLSYKRGDIIRVNFGFRVGAELGGLHYAVVLDKDNKHNANTITVVPLSSLKTSTDSVHDRDLFLGSELYNLVFSKFEKQLFELKSKRDELRPIVETLNQIPETGQTPEIEALIESINKQICELSRETNRLDKDKREIERMKLGSIAKIEQITTISKMRIYVPKKSTDFLSGIRFSQNAMSRINAKIKELYVFDE